MSEVGPRPEGRLATARAALAALEASRARIDDLNVYPVPDGDTGTNMTLTVRAVVDALERDPEADIGRASLMGARGNSGVILSQLVAGALRELSADGSIDSATVARMLRGGVRRRLRGRAESPGGDDPHGVSRARGAGRGGRSGRSG